MGRPYRRSIRSRTTTVARTEPAIAVTPRCVLTRDRAVRSGEAKVLLEGRAGSSSCCLALRPR